MAELKTKPVEKSAAEYIDEIDDDERRADAATLMKIMKKITGAKPRLWTGNMVGFGEYNYKYESGTKGTWFITGFASRKDSLTLYIMSGFPMHGELMKKLGKYKTGKSCLYIKRLADVDLPTLEKLIAAGVDTIRSGKIKSGEGSC